jgi:hypothetical protein
MTVFLPFELWTYQSTLSHGSVFDLAAAVVVLIPFDAVFQLSFPFELEFELIGLVFEEPSQAEGNSEVEDEDIMALFVVRWEPLVHSIN